MGARAKLNAAAIWACVIASAIVGLAVRSWDAFWGLLILAIEACYGGGGIRPQPEARASDAGRGKDHGRSRARKRRG